jgi:transposase
MPGRRTPARLVVRARIVLLAEKGQQNTTIAAELGVQEKTVALWRKRFVEQRLPGIEKDAPGRGRPRSASSVAREAEIVRPTTQETPPEGTHRRSRGRSYLGIRK